MYNINEEGKNIGQKIRLYTAKELHVDASNVTDQPECWRKPEFIARVLLEADEQKYYAPDANGLDKIKRQFTSDTKLEVDLNWLFEKEWLRTVMDIVYLPAVIRGSILLAKKIRYCKNEILFLKTIKKDKERNLEGAKLKQLAKQYEKKKKVKLNIGNAISAHLLSIDDDKVKINNITYYDPIIDNWNNFLFLTFFYDAIYGENNHLIVSKAKLKALYSKHKKKYALTPALTDMLSSGLGTETPKGYIISLLEKRYCSDDTLDEAGAILWRELNNVYSSMPQGQLMKMWCRKFILKGGRNCNVYKYLIKGEKDQFNRAAVAVIMQEPDLAASRTEYRKALLDYYMNRDLTTIKFAERLANAEFAQDSKDAFDTMTAILRMQKIATDDYLYFAQSSRGTISFLIGQIVKSHSCDDYNLDRINDLTKGIHRKPYLLWKLCFWIWEWRPELVPDLMRNAEIASVLFTLHSKFTITRHTFEPVTQIEFSIADTLFKYLLNVLQSNPRTSVEQNAKIVFDCLLATTARQFQIKGQVPMLQRDIQNAAIKLAENIQNEFESRPNQYPIYDNHIHTKDKYYPTLLMNLFRLITALSFESKYYNGTLDFQYEKISLLLFVSKLSGEIPAVHDQLRVPTYEVAKAISECYTNTIAAITIESLDYETWRPKQVTPIFSAASQNIEAIDWGTAFLLLEEQNLSAEFLNPTNLTFNDTGNEYHHFNRFIIDKLRVHLKVLIVTYKQLKSREAYLKNRGVQINKNLVLLQNAILDIAVPYSLNDPAKRRFDIFNNIDERPTFGSRLDELIPQLGDITNHFVAPEREKLISAISRTDTLVRSLKLIETMNSEQDQRILSANLSRLNIAEELEKLRSINDFQFLLSSLSKHSQFQEIAREVLSYWEKNIAPRRLDFMSSEIKVTTYRTKLLLAFQANDLNAIEQVQEPDGEIYVNLTKLYPKNEKDFYRALYYFKNDNPEQSYHIYNDLIYRRDDDTTTIALNRFAAKLNWAEKESDLTKKNILYEDALNEWDAYQKKLSSKMSLEYIASNLRYNKLVALDALEKHDEFDQTYHELGYQNRVKPGFFEIGVRNRLKRKMSAEALILIKEASEFHKLKDGTVPDFVKEMNDLVVASDDPETLKNLFSTVLRAKPDALVKFIPDSVNDGKDPNSYILNHIVDTANDMLSNINAVDTISDEDKYSDLMRMGLNAAMKYHHWSVSPARGGFSDSVLNNPGEIDLAVYSGSNEQLAICEALNLSGENNYEVEKHSVKIFNYTPSKQGLFLLVYYKGEGKNFLKYWEKYKNSIEEKVDFPESYQFLTGSFLDLSDKFNLAAVRVGTSSHDSGITLHHVFMNIHYKTEKKRRTKHVKSKK